MEYWSIGVLEYWSNGVMEYWSGGVLEYWSTHRGAQMEKPALPTGTGRAQRNRVIGLHLLFQ